MSIYFWGTEATPVSQTLHHTALCINEEQIHADLINRDGQMVSTSKRQIFTESAHWPIQS